MTRITENIIESFSIELLDKLGYAYIYAPDIAPDLENTKNWPIHKNRQSDSISAIPILKSVADFSQNGSPRQGRIADFTNSALPKFMDAERKRSQGQNQGQNVLDKQIFKNDLKN